MKSNPILEELWRIKDELAREAGYDIHQFCENLRRWEAEHPQPGRVIRTAEELRQLVAEEERKRAEARALTLKEEPPRQE
jgi:ferric-dicitrate binding protein FerR (iron transport regulator)